MPAEEEAGFASSVIPLAPSRPAGLRLIAFLVGASALLGGLVAGVTVALLVGNDSSPGDPAAAANPRSTLRVEQTSAVTDAAVHARPGVVRVESTKRTVSGAEQDVGSGVVMDTEGHVLTNAHVVLGTETLRIILSDGAERPAILLGHDYPFTDVAVLQISPGKLTPIEPGDSGALRLGQTVIAIGNPLAEFDGSVSVGVLSGIGRQRIFDAVRQDDLLQTDAAVNNGNSGGALLNLDGQFIGMPTAVLRQSRGSQIVEGIAFALPSNRVMQVANRIIAEGGPYPRPSLGIEHVDLSAEVLQRLPRLTLAEGALITSISAGGPAESAGLQAGDVITRLGSEEVSHGNPFLNALTKYEPGQTVRVVLNRNGRIIEAEVRLARRS